MIFFTFFTITTSFKNEMWTLLFNNLWYFQMKMFAILIPTFILQVKNTRLLQHFLLIFFLLLFFAILLTPVVLLILLFMLLFIHFLLDIFFYIFYWKCLRGLGGEGLLAFWGVIWFCLRSAFGMLLEHCFHLIEIVFVIHFYIKLFQLFLFFIILFLITLSSWSLTKLLLFFAITSRILLQRLS